MVYISRINITGYKNTKEESVIKLHKGLNILVGENGSGKTTIVNGLRLLLRENEFSYMNIDEDDFYVSPDKRYTAPSIKISATFDSLSSDDEITFLTWCDAEFKAKLNLEVNANPNKKGYYKKEIWGGLSKSSIFEEETFECIDCIYLPPLRDAEEKLVNGKRSRLAQLLKKQYGENKDSLVESFASFNRQIISNVDRKYNELESAKTNINRKLIESLGQHLGQSINLQFAETTFNKIVENIKMVFFPGIKENDPDKFRDIATNSLGYNNMLYIATVFAELELLKDNNMITVLLIEEPEAHLHPQLQVKFIRYLEDLTVRLENTQVIITTHSPVLASSVNTDNIIHVTEHNQRIVATSLKDIDLGGSKQFINRWLDTTKSTLLFSKGLILVEGISEAMLIPALANVVLSQYNIKVQHNSERMLPSSLDESAVSTININGINFKHFMKLFSSCDGSKNGEKLPLLCAGITDNDPPKLKTQMLDEDGEPVFKRNGEPVFKLVEVFPSRNDSVLGANSALKLIEDIQKSNKARLFSSPLKTFEYDLLMEGNISIMAKVLQRIWSSGEGSVNRTCSSIVKQNDKYSTDEKQVEHARYIFEHIESKQLGKGVFAQELADYLNMEIRKINQDGIDENEKKHKISKLFHVPEYISNAIIWSCGGVLNE